MTLELNKPYFVKRVANKSGTLHYLPMDGFCDGVALDKPVLAKRVANKDGTLHFLLSDQKLEPDGKLKLNKPYFAKRVANKDGVLHYLVAGKQCEGPGNPTLCGCEVCCTLTGTLSVNDESDGWTEEVEVELTCGGTIETTSGYFCVNDEVIDDLACIKVTTTWSEKDTIGSPEAYTDGVTSGTQEYKSHIWSSGDIDIGGETYRLSYWRVQVTKYQTLPTVTTIEQCLEGIYIQKLSSEAPGFETCHTPFWSPVLLSGAPGAPYFNISDDGPETVCPEGYSFAAGELLPYVYSCNYPLLVLGDDFVTSDCPVFYAAEYYYFPPGPGPFDCEDRIPCVRYSIIDKCGPRIPCSLGIAAGGFDTVDYEVENCHPSSGTHTTNGNPASGFDMFAGGTGAILTANDTQFDSGDLIDSPDAYWPDAEEMNWVSVDGSLDGNIQLALCCVTPEEGEPYLAAYALLTLVCEGPGDPATCTTRWAYKTRDLDVRIVGGYLEVSFTGLTPMGSDSGECGCTCDAPTLSVTMRRQISDCP